MQVLKHHTTQLSHTTLESSLAGEESDHCHLHSLLSSKWQISPLAHCRTKVTTESSKQSMHHSLPQLTPSTFHCLIDVILTTQVRTPGGILDSSLLPLQCWVYKSSLMGTLPVHMRCHNPCSDVIAHDPGYIESPKDLSAFTFTLLSNHQIIAESLQLGPY